MSSSQSLSMLSCCHLHFVNSSDNVNKTAALKTCYQTGVSSPNSSVNKAILFHRKFGHPNFHVLLHMLKNIKSIHFSASQIQQSHQTICEACQKGKIQRHHFPIADTKTSKVLELIHIDLWGPSPTGSRDNYQYYISVVDDISRYTWIYPLKVKSDALTVFKLFKSLVEN